MIDVEEIGLIETDSEKETKMQIEEITYIHTFSLNNMTVLNNLKFGEEISMKDEEFEMMDKKVS